MIYLNGKKVGAVMVDVVEKEIPVEVPVEVDTAFKKFIQNDYDSETELTLPDDITYLKPYAFGNFPGKKVNLPANLQKIGSNCFNQCNNLTEFIMPDSVTEVEEQFLTWSGGNGFTVKLSENLENLSQNCFRGCRFIQIRIPASVQRVGANAFNSCRQMTSIAFEGWTVPKIETTQWDNADSIFGQCDNLQNIYVKDFTGWKSSDWGNQSWSDKIHSYYGEVNIKYYNFSDPVIINKNDTNGIVKHHFVADATNYLGDVEHDVDYVISFNYEVSGPNETDEDITTYENLVVGVGEQQFEVNFTVIHLSVDPSVINLGKPVTFSFGDDSDGVYLQNNRGLWRTFTVNNLEDGHYYIAIENDTNSFLNVSGHDGDPGNGWYNNGNFGTWTRMFTYNTQYHNWIAFSGEIGKKYTITITRAED